MELSGQLEGEIPIPIPINSSYDNGDEHMTHHDPAHNTHIMSSSSIKINPSNGFPGLEDHGSYKKMVRYKECLKNHAAGMGGNATDGCGEFLPSGVEGTIEALNCSACHCHRNFHRKEVEGEAEAEHEPYSRNSHFNSRLGKKFILGHHVAPEALGYPTAANILPSRTVPPHHMIMGSLSIPSESDEQEARPPQIVKKRFRTKFTQEQKDRMINFADKVGWKIQKQEESLVQHFCQEIGVKRRVLKVWMHNNKHNLAKKNPPAA
ncbi:zinc-finger homeodomain protein 3-like [Gastrolobium bilobum]|uniref:zinc-finger homeodomain protein 3-like n=1 Tax=Gastrolobium bilobum TaxID=150636 RepID=UPI002AB15043|nr:zinc-finger homeodomain protein 3-like [Gastrolobium bilobum]